MNQTLKIGLVQSSLFWESPEENRLMFSKKIDSISKDVKLIVLPEMFTSGFTMSPEHIDKDEGPKTISWMKEKAVESGAAIIGSSVFNENGGYYNRLFFVQPNGTVSSYDKRHTFTLAGEHEKYEAGNKLILIDFMGFRFCPLICYDLRFPVWSRNTANYDVLLYVANWPEPRINAWDALLKARAIENMSYCIGVNRIGSDSNGYKYNGHSAVYDALGVQLAFSTREEVMEVVINKDHIQDTRRKLRFLEDRDEFILN
ncbi:amidohydrolase [Maribacter aestuarii]|uniref:amidohydrolase n=1 Tax=Maribacter aestuarii TaxID=1130723 RepID=UPI00248B6C5D|nr:amidohydrolase [Maribacter aestuarii]